MSKFEHNLRKIIEKLVALTGIEDVEGHSGPYRRVLRRVFSVESVNVPGEVRLANVIDVRQFVEKGFSQEARA